MATMAREAIISWLRDLWAFRRLARAIWRLGSGPHLSEVTDIWRHWRGWRANAVDFRRREVAAARIAAAQAYIRAVLAAEDAPEEV